MGKFEIKANTVKNRLYIILEGFLTDEEVKKVTEGVVQESQKLKPGYSVINDISTFKPATAQAAEEIKKVQVYVKEHGVGRVIRVVQDQALGAMQLERNSKEAGYKADVASSVAEAEKALGD